MPPAATPEPPQLPTYTVDIPGLHQENLGLPPTLGLLDLNRHIAAGSPIDPVNLREAKTVVKSLKGLHEFNQNVVSTEALEMAELRLAYITSEHARAKYAPAGFGERLDHLSRQIENLALEIVMSRAGTYNDRIIAHNRCTLPRTWPSSKKMPASQPPQESMKMPSSPLTPPLATPFFPLSLPDHCPPGSLDTTAKGKAKARTPPSPARPQPRTATVAPMAASPEGSALTSAIKVAPPAAGPSSRPVVTDPVQHRPPKVQLLNPVPLADQISEESLEEGEIRLTARQLRRAHRPGPRQRQRQKYRKEHGQ